MNQGLTIPYPFPFHWFALETGECLTTFLCQVSVRKIKIKMPATKVNLSQMVDLAVGTPEVGAVNCNVLHTLLHEHLYNIYVEIKHYNSLSPITLE
jgi:hypothetical protein